MKKFTETNTQVLRAELSGLVSAAAFDMYAEKVENVQQLLEVKLQATISELFRLKLSMPEDKIFNAARPHDEVIKYIVSNFVKEDRAPAYKYANLTRLKVLLNSILTSKVKLRKVVLDTLTNLINAEISAPKGRAVTLSQAINCCPLKVVTTHRVGVEDTETKMIKVLVKGRNNVMEEVEVPSAQWELDEIKLQLIAELCELDLVNMKISDHTHMLDIPSKIASVVTKAEWLHMWELGQIIEKKTILLEPASVDNRDLVTRSSWYYKTPNLSPDMIECINVLQSTKYEFVDNALDLIEEAYMEHLVGEDGSMPENWKQWVPQRLAFFKEQIAASQANGGHYLVWKTDSANRMYTQAEIGGLQTSSALRALVKVSGIDNKVKYDFRNNVVQMYALLMKTENLAKYVYLVDESKRAGDLRQLIANALNIVLETDVFNKDNIKPLFMVWAYNAGKDRILDGVTIEEESLFGMNSNTVKVKGLIAITGAANTEANRDMLWTAFHDTVVELAPEIVLLKAIFKKLIKNNPLTETQWTLPDGTIAQYASAATAHQTLFFVDSKGKQHQHTQYRKLILENAKSAGLLPRVIHSFDAYVARQLVVRAYRLGIIIVPNHDSFTFDAKYKDTVFALVNELFVELLEGNYMGEVLNELNTSRKSLATYTKDKQAITDELIWTKFGKLTTADLASSEPLDYED